MDKLFKALSDITRRELLLLIFSHSKLCLCELETVFNLSNSNLSRHLKALEIAKLIKSEKIGKWKHYQISDLGILSVGFIDNVEKKCISEVKIKKIGGMKC